MSSGFVPLLKTFAEVMCFELGNSSLWLFLNCDNALKSSLLCQHGCTGTTQKQSNSLLSRRAQHFHAWRRLGQTSSFQSEMRANFFLWVSWYCTLKICSQGWNCKPFLFRCSAASMARCVTKTIQEVVHCRLVSSIRQCSCSVCFVCAGISS